MMHLGFETTLNLKMATRPTKWEKFKEQMKQKRKGRNLQKDSEEEIVVQPLSASVSGKAQKYTRIGSREFVEFGDHELTINNKKTACMKHFSPKIDGNVVCDVLAGSKGLPARMLNKYQTEN